MSSRTSTSMAPSWRCPPVSTIASGIPLPSTAAWILLPRPPRERPTACPSGSSCARFLWFAFAPCGLVRAGGVGPVLVGTVDRRVHRHRPVDVTASISLSHQYRVDLVPHSQPRVEVVALPHRLPGSEPLPGQIPPRNTSPSTIDDALHDHPVVLERMPLTTLVRGQQRLNPLPLLIRKSPIPGRCSSSHPSTLKAKPPHIWETRPSSPMATPLLTSIRLCGRSPLRSEERRVGRDGGPR